VTDFVTVSCLNIRDGQIEAKVLDSQQEHLRYHSSCACVGESGALGMLDGADDGIVDVVVVVVNGCSD